MVQRTFYALEVRDICMNGRHTRNKRVMKRVSNAVMTRECHADVMRMLRGCWADLHARQNANSGCFVERGRCVRRCTQHANIPSRSSLTSDTYE
jgi:hypothetical protein